MQTVLAYLIVFGIMLTSVAFAVLAHDAWDKRLHLTGTLATALVVLTGALAAAAINVLFG